MKKAFFKGYDLNRCSANVLSLLCYVCYYDHYLHVARFYINLGNEDGVCIPFRHISYNYYKRLISIHHHGGF